MTLVPNFKILSQVVNEKSLTKNSIFITYIGVRDRKKKKGKKKCKKKSLHLRFVFNNTLGRPYPVYKI